MEDILKTRQFESLIFELRGYKVMIDADLASLYETETKRLIAFTEQGVAMLSSVLKSTKAVDKMLKYPC